MRIRTMRGRHAREEPNRFMLPTRWKRAENRERGTWVRIVQKSWPNIALQATTVSLAFRFGVPRAQCRASSRGA